ncbi:hypothetical protein HanIR_Chr03g0119181 [Helianthus annuus]|nr:hypothetical protein HanIR_Chr03g0119181 [Helianthus annuus]
MAKPICSGLWCIAFVIVFELCFSTFQMVGTRSCCHWHCSHRFEIFCVIT